MKLSPDEQDFLGIDSPYTMREEDIALIKARRIATKSGRPVNSYPLPSSPLTADHSLPSFTQKTADSELEDQRGTHD